MLKNLQERKLTLVNNMRSMLDKDSNFEETNYEAMDSELTSLEKQISRAIKLDSIEKTMSEVRDEPTIETPVTRADVKKSDEAKRYKDAFEQMLRSPMHTLSSETRAVLNTGTASEGGHTVPVEYYTNVINKLLETSTMRQISNVIKTSSTTKIPLGVGRPTFALIAENGSYGDTDASFGQVSLDAFKLGGIIKASEELLQDSFVDIQSYLSNLIVEGIADQEEGYFTNGVGTTTPTGILTGGTLGKTTTAIAAVTMDEVLDLIYSLKSGYRSNAKLVMNSSTELALRKIKGTDGQYLWQPSIQLGMPNTFDGRPIIINEKMPSLGTGNKFMAYGDFKYFTIADRAGLDVKRMDELYSASGQVGWRVSKRFDSKVIQSEAIKFMANA